MRHLPRGASTAANDRLRANRREWCSGVTRAYGVRRRAAWDTLPHFLQGFWDGLGCGGYLDGSEVGAATVAADGSKQAEGGNATASTAPLVLLEALMQGLKGLTSVERATTWCEKAKVDLKVAIGAKPSLQAPCRLGRCSMQLSCRTSGDGSSATN